MNAKNLALVAVAVALSSAPARADRWPNIPIPANNAATLRSAPARPAAGDVSDRARHLVDALNGGSADGALDFFLPLDPFLAIKDMNGARGYHAQLIREYRRDIETFRAQLPRGQRVDFVRFEPSRSCTWMGVGREWNRLPYWSCYGSRLVVRAGDRETSLRVHVIIHWGDRWYVTHLDRTRRR
ncbi:MAG: hypothetical protein JNK05_13020 [Myxococcales bacterium]|nr:hypothetical protein [Myxococcales bacterium]